jgi:formylglycine-generating enzyme required for sulfatase activity
VIGRFARTATVHGAEEILMLDSSGLPACDDSEAILHAVDELIATGDEDLIDELLLNSFLRGRHERYAHFIAPYMRSISGTEFAMGTDAAQAGHFCGESPRHVVSLSPYEIGACPVTKTWFGLFRREKSDTRTSELREPAVNVTWFDAALFAMWVGCRLPTEAEWEFACGAGSENDWFCENEVDLGRYAWYSENSHGDVRPVGRRDPGANGTFDMHGNVWEWCGDDYDALFYERSPDRDPSCWVESEDGSHPHKVARGGSVHSLAEMCRSRYRLHDPPDFFASDLGFRLARDAVGTGPDL